MLIEADRVDRDGMAVKQLFMAGAAFRGTRGTVLRHTVHAAASWTENMRHT